MSQSEEPEAPPAAKTPAEQTREMVASFIVSALPFVLRHLYPDPPEPASDAGSWGPETTEEFAVTSASADGPSLGKVPRPQGEGWEPWTSHVEAGGATVLWRRDVEVGEPSFHGNAV